MLKKRDSGTLGLMHIKEKQVEPRTRWTSQLSLPFGAENEQCQAQPLELRPEPFAAPKSMDTSA